MKKIIPLLPLVLLLQACSATSSTTMVGEKFACKNYSSQAQAQSAWESAGSPSANDRDGDGRVCSSLASSATSSSGSAKTTGCRTQAAPVIILLSRAKYPQTSLHIEDAIRNGQPEVLHIDRVHDEANRIAWQALVPKSLDTDGDGKVEDRDEWPMASSREGGRRSSEGKSLSSVAFVGASDNRGAGSSIGTRLRPYCDGQAFKVKFYSYRLKPTRIIVAAANGKKTNRIVEAPGR